MTELFDSINFEAYVIGAWASISADVLMTPEPTWNMGIMVNSPTDRVGDPEYLKFSLDNSEMNSAFLQGYYTPGHANCKPGWDTGIDIRLYFVFEGEIFYKYYGKIMPSGINATTSIYGRRSVAVSCHGFMAQASDHDFALPTLQTNLKIGASVSALLTNMPIQPLATSLTTGGDTFPTMFDTVQKRTTALGELQKMAQSEYAYIYTKGDKTGGQTLVAESRITRSGLSNFTAPSADDVSTLVQNEDGDQCINEDTLEVDAINDETQTIDFSGRSLFGMKDPSYGKNMSNEVKAVTTPRKVDAVATTVLFQTQERILVAANTTKSNFRGDYRDPNGGASYVNGKEMVTPVSGTDYTMFANSDGTGANLTASLVVTATYGTEAVEYDLQNTGGTDGYVFLQARGKGIYIYDEVAVVVSDTTSINKHGKHSLNFDMKYQNDPAKGEAIAQIILGYEKDPNRTIEDYPMLANVDSDSMMGFLYGEPGVRSTFTEPMNAINDSYFIMGYTAKIVANLYVFWSPVLFIASHTVGSGSWIWDVSLWDVNTTWGFPE